MGGVAVIDLDQVAQQLGRTDVIAEQLKQKEQAMNAQLANFQAKLTQQLRDAQQRAGERPTEQAKKELAQLDAQLGAHLRQGQATLARELQTHRGALIDAFRNEVRPIARQIADERGLGAVFSKNDVIFSAPGSIDITSAVVAAMRTATPETASAGGSTVR